MKILRFLAALCFGAAVASAAGDGKVTSIDIYVTPYYSANVGKSECVNIRDEMGTLLASDDAENSSYGANNIRRSADGRADDLFKLSTRACDLGLRCEAVLTLQR